MSFVILQISMWLWRSLQFKSIPFEMLAWWVSDELFINLDLIAWHCFNFRYIICIDYQIGFLVVINIGAGVPPSHCCANANILQITKPRHHIFSIVVFLAISVRRKELNKFVFWAKDQCSKNGITEHFFCNSQQISYINIQICVRFIIDMWHGRMGRGSLYL